MGELEKEKIRLEALIDSSLFSIKCEIDALEEELAEYEDLKLADRNDYVNIYDLISKMKNDGIYTPELEEYFEKYLKFNND